MDNLQKVIKKVRDILRNEGITGMDSINHCIAFIIMKYMDKDTCEKMNIPIKYSYESIMNHIETKDIGNNDIQLLIMNRGNECVLHYIHANFKFTNIKYKIKTFDNLIKIMKSIEELNFEELNSTKDIIGTIYEIHLKTGSAGGGMRDLGQYFTHRLVIVYMIALCDPKKIGNQIEKIVDPTCGTGGFLTMAIKYLDEKYDDSIDWELNKDNIIGFDLDENVINISKINLLIESHTFFENVIKRDTLYNDMKLSDDQGELMADILLCNEPMGVKNIIHASCCNRIKKGCKELEITGTAAEPLFLQLFMKSLNENGRCAVVVPDGVLFNESNLHQGTRKKLIEEFNLEKVITLNDKEFFLNTGVKTSIMYFENNGKTTKTSFSSISLTDDEIIEEHIMDVDYDTLVENNYSLFINKYKVSLENRIDGIEYKKLGDICEFLPKSKRPASFGKDIGEFEFFTSSMKIKRCDIADYNQKSLIIGTGGNANIKIGKNFSCSSDNFILSNNNDITIKYIYYYLSININLLENGFVGSTIKHISKVFVNSLEIPIPSLEVQNAIVEQLDIINILKSKIMHLNNIIDKDQNNILTDLLMNSNSKESSTYCDNLQMMIYKLEENIENNNILMKTILENKMKQQSGESDKIVTNKISNKYYNINGNNYLKQTVPGDGHCFFHAVALYLKQDVNELRDKVATYMLDNQEDFIEHYEAGEHNDITYDEFVELIRSTNEWADNLVIQAIQKLIDRPVQVYQDNNGELIQTEEVTIDNENEPIMVLYNGTNHYDSLIITDELTTPHAINDSPQTKLSKEEVSKLTIPKIKKLLDDLDIKYKSSNKKDALIDLYLK